MTNKIVLQTVDQFMADYQPVYQPIFPLFLAGAKQYADVVGTVTSKRLEAVGDIRNHHINPKDTNIHQITSKISSKVFKKYFLGSQYIESNLQDHEGAPEIVAQVLDEHNKHQDDLLFLGEGTSASTMVNNGLFWSNDPNYDLKSSSALAAGSDVHLTSMYNAIMATALEANKVSGRKLLLVYGATATAKLGGLFASAPVPFQGVLSQALPGWDVVVVPSDIAISGDGWIAVNLDQIQVHYSVVPQLKSQGVNEEKNYTWHNFLMGSMMVEVKSPDGIIRQPVTFA